MVVKFEGTTHPFPCPNTMVKKGQTTNNGRQNITHSSNDTGT